MPTEKLMKQLQNKIRIKNDLLRCCLAEYIGICVLVLIVNGGGASVITSGLSTIENTLWLSWGACFGIGFGIWTAFGVSGGHVNPSVTIGLAATGKFPWKRVPYYFFAQFCGAFTGCVICYLVYYDAINNFDGGTRIAVGNETATCGIFTTFPAPYLTLTTGFFEQVVNTGIMLGLVLMISDNRNAGPVFSLKPFFFGTIVFIVVLTYSVNAGSPLNPARDFAGRIMCTIAGYGPEVWSPYGVQWWWIPTFGPLVGAVVGSWLYVLFVEIHHPPENGCSHPDIDQKDELREELNDSKEKEASKKILSESGV